MRFTITNRGHRRAFEAQREFSIGGDPDRDGIAPGLDGPWNGQLGLEPAGWVLVVEGRPCTCNGRPIDGSVIVYEGDVIEVGGASIRIDQLSQPAFTAPRLSDTERGLLGLVGDDLSDDHARLVLADHWQDGFDVARGEFVRLQCEGIAASAPIEADRQRWLRTARAAGFSDAALELVRGFVKTALVVEDGEPLDGCPDGLRLSPRQYRVVRNIRVEEYGRVFEATMCTAGGDGGRYVVKCPPRHASKADTMERELAILSRIHHPNVPAVVDFAIVRPDSLAIVLPWAGIPLRTVFEHAAGPREPLAISIGLQLCDALAAIHDHGILHREIEPEHVLVAEDGHVTLAGFGLASASWLGPAFQNDTKKRSRNFRYSSDDRHGPRSDLFSLALVIAATAQGYDPIAPDPHNPIVVAARKTLRQRQVINLPSGTSLADLLRRTIMCDPDDRPSLATFATELACIGTHDRALIARTIRQLPVD